MRPVSPASDEAAAIDLAELLRPGDSIVWGQGPAEPATLVELLLLQQDRVAPVTVLVGTMLTDRLRQDPLRGLSIKGFIGMGPAGVMVDEGRLDLLPCPISELPRLIARGLLRVDVVFVQVSLPDAAGNHSLGLAADYLIEAIQRARVVVAEVNARVPFVLGDSLVHRSAFAAVVATSRPLIEVPALPHRPVDRAIAAHAAGLIPDRATVQVGIGRTPDAILGSLQDKTDLGVHSGMITDRIAQLMEAGVITNRCKEIDTGVTVTGTLFGTEGGLYRYADRNPRIRLQSAAYTHTTSVIARLDRFVAINSAVEVDLTGQINSEATPEHYLGAVGGQLDFTIGAMVATEGRSIVALASTADTGLTSRIVARSEVGIVSIPRGYADCIVTEFGVAELRGQTLRERARRLVGIAHPDFRRELARDAKLLLG